MRISRGVVAGLGMVFGVALAASAAFACTPSAHIFARPGSGPGGSQIVVDGSAWDSTGPIDLHWNSVDGPPLASVPMSVTGGGGSFSVPVRIPDVAADVYTIVATQPRLGGGVTKAAAAFQVTATGVGSGTGGSSTTPSSQTTTRASGGSGSSSPASSSPGDSASPAGTADNEAVAGASAPAGSSSAAAPAASGPAANVSTTAAAAPGAVSASAREVGTSSSATVATARAAHAGALAVAAPAQSIDQALRVDQAPGPVNPTAMVSDDLWSGLVTPSGPGRGPSLVEAPAPGHGSAVTVGVGMLSLALVALFAGFGLAEVRRRRVSVSAAG